MLETNETRSMRIAHTKTKRAVVRVLFIVMKLQLPIAFI